MRYVLIVLFVLGFGVLLLTEFLTGCLSAPDEELAAVRRVLGMVGVPIRPATFSGPQYAEWPEFVRFHRTLLAISEAEVAGMRDGIAVAPSTLAGVVAGSVSS